MSFSVAAEATDVTRDISAALNISEILRAAERFVVLAIVIVMVFPQLRLFNQLDGPGTLNPAILPVGYDLKHAERCF